MQLKANYHKVCCCYLKTHAFSHHGALVLLWCLTTLVGSQESHVSCVGTKARLPSLFFVCLFGGVRDCLPLAHFAVPLK